jgi:hypothetical protein
LLAAVSERRNHAYRGLQDIPEAYQHLNSSGYAISFPWLSRSARVPPISKKMKSNRACFLV